MTALTCRLPSTRTARFAGLTAQVTAASGRARRRATDTLLCHPKAAKSADGGSLWLTGPWTPGYVRLAGRYTTYWCCWINTV